MSPQTRPNGRQSFIPLRGNAVRAQNREVVNMFAPLLRTLRRRLRTEERGFTVVELMVAQGIILVSLLSLAYTATVGFQDIALARQREGANALANRVIEQVR